MRALWSSRKSVPPAPSPPAIAEEQRSFFDIEPAASRGEPLMVPIDQLDADPHNPRTEISQADLEEMKQDIASRGVLQPIVVTPADVQDRDGAKLALAAFRSVVKFPEVIWADTAYRSVVRWARVQWLWVVEIVSRPRGRFVLQPRRWIVERTFGWLNRSRRLAKCWSRLRLCASAPSRPKPQKKLV